jgi:hypothetical protein
MQCKSGPCNMRVYDAPQEQIPDEILESLKSDNPYYMCGSCGQEFALDVMPIVRVVKTLVLSPLEEGQVEFFSRRGATLTHDPTKGLRGIYVDPIWSDEEVEECPPLFDGDAFAVGRMLDRMDADDLKREVMAHLDQEAAE